MCSFGINAENFMLKCDCGLSRKFWNGASVMNLPVNQNLPSWSFSVRKGYKEIETEANKYFSCKNMCI